jgi:hypothetical protein
MCPLITTILLCNVVHRFLTPKQVKTILESRWYQVQIENASAPSEDLEKEERVLGDEIRVIEAYLEKQAHRMVIDRATKLATRGVLLILY